MTTRRRDGGMFQTDFGRWLQANPRLDSGLHGISATDNDMIIHRYKQGYDLSGIRAGQREINHIMHVEIKTYNAAPTFAQRDTLLVLNATLLRLSLEEQKLGRYPKKVKTHKVINKRGNLVTVKIWGVHLLTLSGSDPINSDEMIWNNSSIDIYKLECLLRFELNPFTIKKIDDRRHHKHDGKRFVS